MRCVTESADRIEFVCTSYLDGVDPHFDLITANPPYVRDIDKRGLSADVLQEPHVALFGGDTGLDHVEAVLSSRRADMLPSGGWLVMEFGFGQEDDVRERAGGTKSCGSITRAPICRAWLVPLSFNADERLACSARSSLARFPAISSTRTRILSRSRTSIRRRRFMSSSFRASTSRR
jgi:hypothetical protein